MESLSKALNISATELFSGQEISNNNPSGNIQKSKFYVCPICGNVIHSMGETVIMCHGIQLIPLQAQEATGRFKINGARKILYYCNKDGLFKMNIVKGFSTNK